MHKMQSSETDSIENQTPDFLHLKWTALGSSFYIQMTTSLPLINVKEEEEDERSQSEQTST